MARRVTTVSGGGNASTVPNPAPLAAEVEQCGRCRFFQWDDDGPIGACHRGPPRSGQAAGNWPVVRPGDWCGEFRGSAA